MRLYLIRHAQPIDAAGLCYGRGEVAVDPRVTRVTAETIRSHLPAEVLRDAPVYSSPLGRCLDLATELASGRGVSVADDLAELSFGSWEGRRWEDVPREQLDAWNEDLWGYRPGGGESAREATDRWVGWLAQVPTSRYALVVTHAGLIRIALAAGGSSGRLIEPIAYGSIHPVDHADYVLKELV